MDWLGQEGHGEVCLSCFPLDQATTTAGPFAACRGGGPAQPYRVADRELSKWLDIWSWHGDKRTPAELIPEPGTHMEPLTGADIERVAATFPIGTAMGADQFQPKLIEGLSAGAHDRMTQLLNGVERAGEWPGRCMLAIMVSLGKPGGGTRLIALLQTLVRVWSRARRSYTKQWEDAHRHPCFYGCTGRSSSAAAMDRDLQEEAAVAAGGYSTTVLLDLAKAFDSVAWDVFVAEAAATGFPMQLLALILQTYHMARVVKVERSLSRACQVFQSILAGCMHATTGLNIVLYRAVIRTAAANPRTTIRFFVDDGTVQATGPGMTPARRAVHCAGMLLQEYKGLRLFPSKGKLKAVTSSTEVHRHIRSVRRRHGISIADWARNLGHDCRRSGTARVIAGDRLKKGRCTGARVQQLGKAVGKRAHRLVRCAILPSVTHSAAVQGATDTQLARMRTATAAAMGLPRYTGHTAHMLLAQQADADPMFGVTVPRLATYLQLLWAGALRLEQLSATWRSLEAKLEASTRPWALVTGPLGPLRAHCGESDGGAHRPLYGGTVAGSTTTFSGPRRPSCSGGSRRRSGTGSGP